MPFQQQHVVEALFTDFPSAVFFASPDKRIEAANPAALRMFGYALEDILRQPVRLLFSSDDEYRICLTKRQERAITDRSIDSLFRFQRRDGEIFQGEMRTTLIDANDGETRGFIGVITDVTAMRVLEERQLTAERFLNTALGVIDQGFAIFDKDERLVVFNAAYESLFGGVVLKAGMAAQEIMDLALKMGAFGSFETDADRRSWTDERLAVLRAIDTPHRILRYADGRLWRCEDRRLPDGSTVALRVDVTEVQQALTAVERREREYLTLLQNLPELVCRFSSDRTVLFANQGYAQFFGLQPNDLIGRDVLHHVPTEAHEPMIVALQAITPETPRSTRETVHHFADGSTCSIEWTLVGVFDHSVATEFVAVGRDVTEHKRRNEALSLFAATVAHDLKAPLRHVASFSEMMSEDLEAGRLDTLGFYAGNIRQSTERMQRLIQNLLEYAQIAHRITKTHCVDLSAVVRDAIALMETTVSETAARIEIGRLPHVSGDPELLKRLAQNLIANALKYHQPDREPVVRVYGANHPLYVSMIVEDEGIGIDPAQEARIFDLFHRLHRDESVYKGTGVGLAIAKRIVESHGGKIRLDPAYRDGARFIVTLPPEVAQVDPPAADPFDVGSCN
ncbi:PAS domain S-box-containing protein [Rhizobium sp. RU20A]|uniref:PAS domain S-box protein n=1 Tax=Rhizobium sp. RU20A TaxID=1907412 RepID=UPI0009547059|nr:PAS domain S-box protein [Rhizobium sp. RU20A]SIQ07813.1 PAS domain S-box-containing protein [Rhizobium sp. RU20A]